jgi:hypothetical protein
MFLLLRRGNGAEVLAWRVWKAEFKGKVTVDVLAEVRAKLKTLLFATISTISFPW